MTAFFICLVSGTISSWASKTNEIITNVGILGVLSIEKYLGYFFDNNISAADMNISYLFDRMTHQVFTNAKEIDLVIAELKRKP